MFLTSLELVGFKSFPDRIKVDFERGLTGIVGPNGSGKSNISDAVRWVLGEQSSRMLRGNRMEDVIFGGTEKRNPLGFAEVILTIDNSDRSLRCDSDVVSVSRRYYRSGDSEYCINKKTVRLRDVNELFLDTGLGRDGYSIIGQGRIDEVLSQKSEDRREIFEEAAGIAKYRVRKEEAERKLSHVSDNLTRLTDIVSELESQLGPLRKKAEKAKEYLRIYEELRGLEAALATIRAGELRGESQKLFGSLRIAEALLSEARTRLEKLYAENEEANAELERLNADGEKARTGLREAETALAAAENAVNLADAEIKSASDRAQRLEFELRIRNERSEELFGKVEEKRAALGDIEERIALAGNEQAEVLNEIELADRARAGTDEKISAVLAREALVTEALASLEREKSSARASLEERKRRLEEIRESAGTIEGMLKAGEEKAAAMDGEIKKKEEEKASLINVKNGYLLMKRRRDEKNRTDSAAHTSLLSELNGVNQRLSVLKDLEKEYEGFSRAVKTVMQMAGNRALRGIVGTLASLVTVPREYTLAIETALGGALQDIVTETEQDARDAIEMLRSRNAGRATFLPKTFIRGNRLNEKEYMREPGYVGIAVDLCSFDPELEGIFTQQLGRTLVTDRMDSAIRIARKFGQKFRIVTLDGQVVNAGGSMTGGSQVKNAGILSRANDIRELEEKRADLGEKVKAAEVKARESARAAAELDYSITQTDAELAELVSALREAIAAKEQHMLLLESIRVRCDELGSEELGSVGAVKELENRLSDFNGKIDEQNGNLRAIEAELQALNSGRSGQLSEHDRLAEKLTAVRMKLAGLESEKNAALEAIAEAELVADTATDDRRRSEDELAAVRRAKSEAELRLEEGNKKCALCRTAVSLREETVNGIVAERFAAEARRSAADSLIREQNDAVLAMEREKNELTRKRDAAEDELKQLGDKLWENFELTLGEAADKATPIESRAAAQRRSAELKSRRRALGTVDPASVEECAEAEARYEYLSSQKADVEKSSQELCQLIFDITKEMTDIFLDAFGRINSHFADTFRDLFGGGTAELMLTDPSDALNCGIEIRVCPPGKSLKFISLLSGGEKAMVAIALYFAIMKVQPSPFCVLDEIDAALDEQNVARFASYVERLTENTQFIVITHRRGTMDAMDRLYGVTMLEQGISKLIPVNMDEIEQKIKLKKGAV
ncbi:MAG: chromosome segregation protein SMC [Ruminococcaceae bacterium]|nr:chromosome segregation protein SMC [Oscillospiraceae bacterium]